MTRAAWLVAFALPLAAQPELLVNAQLKTQSAAAGLESVFRPLLALQPQPAWIGYSVPSVRSWGLGCDYVRDGAGVAGVVHLEPPDHAVILFRVEGNAVNRIRSLSPHCEIDAGGLPVYWLADVQPAQSVALLAAFTFERDRQGDGITAIAQHSGAAADQALDRFAAAGQPEALRLRAVSALGRRGGPAAVATLSKVIDTDSEIQVRRRAVSALNALPGGAGIPLLIQVVKTTGNAEVRKQAMSTLGQSRDPRAVTFFEDVLKR